IFFFFFFQAEDGIRDLYVTGVQTCALPIFGKQRTARTQGAPACAPCAACRAAREDTERSRPPEPVVPGDAGADARGGQKHAARRSEERRVGKECRSGWGREHGRKRRKAEGR